MPVSVTGLSQDVERAIDIYERRLKTNLEPEHSGKSVAIDADSGDYEIGRSHGEAARSLKDKRPPGVHIVTLTIGPPTPQDISLAHRMAGVR